MKPSRHSGSISSHDRTIVSPIGTTDALELSFQYTCTVELLPCFVPPMWSCGFLPSLQFLFTPGERWCAVLLFWFMPPEVRRRENYVAG